MAAIVHTHTSKKIIIFSELLMKVGGTAREVRKTMTPDFLPRDVLLPPLLLCYPLSMLRLERILSNRGYCTRGETDRFLDDHVVTHAGVRLRRSGVQVDAEKLLIDDQPLDAEKLYVLYHKPAGCICAHGDAGPEGGTLVYDLLPSRWVMRNPVVTTVGRLDKETTGLLLLSDDGQFVHKLTSPKHHVPRVYQAELQHDLRGNEKAIFAWGS